MTETPREIGENLIMQWYEKKLNRDELLRVLGGIKSIDKESKKKIERQIIENFYENYESEKNKKDGYSGADKLYRDLKKDRRELAQKEREISEPEKKIKKERKNIRYKMIDISEIAMELDNGPWWKRMKLKGKKEEWKELERKRKEIEEEYFKLEKSKIELEKKLKKQEEEYGPEIERDRKGEGRRIEEYNGGNIEQISEKTLKGYKKRYEQVIKDKEEYMEKCMRTLEGMDIGVSDNKKKEVMKVIEGELKGEIERLKEGDETMKKAEEIEKWLEENYESTIKRLLNLEESINKKEEEIGKIRTTYKGVEAKKREYGLRAELIDFKKEYEVLNAELGERILMYDGSKTENLFVETWKEREERLKEKEHSIDTLKTQQELDQKEYYDAKITLENVPVEDDSKSEEWVDTVDSLESETAGKVSQELNDFRENWEKNVKRIDDKDVRKIIEVAKNIPVEVKKNIDGSKLIKFKLGKKTYKILDINVEAHTDDKYRDEEVNDNGMKRYQVKQGGMMGNDVDKWENEKLKKYVKKMQRKGFHIPKENEMLELLEALGKEADLWNESSQIAILSGQIGMLMYLIGMEGMYWLSERDFGIPNLCVNQRSWLYCTNFYRTLGASGHDSASAGLCMIALK